ncbi:hypothetical protein [Thermococcus barophilus]|uniref:Uncharacterized protein n=2 Tax=Thermococcus barophilus TaxID=55802 RepID=A0A0S1XF03_THEBA|nr:hypothetical protein [Thermococcus barophilus]ADT84996.1 hypothetical protein TERMP_02022 [Thermococcus barophilus MP]ALM76306.1 hypothetical protein TBCH5v1_2415 [Thermococcus barophilus]
MSDVVKDSVEVALELNEKEVYSHIAHESAEDIIRIISSLDAERAKNRGEVIYYQDDWDDLIRQRIQKGKRHTAFDFYNPALLNIWEAKVKYLKKVRNYVKLAMLGILAFLAVTIILSFFFDTPWFLVGVSALPLLIFFHSYRKEKLDFAYYQLTQFFIDELRELVLKHQLDSTRYKFKIFSYDYFGILTRKIGSSIFAIVKTGENMTNTE